MHKAITAPIGIAAPPVVESFTTFVDNAGTAKTVNMPATRPDGDLYVMVIGVDRANNVADTPAGWTFLLSTGTDAGNNPVVHVFWRVGDSEPATYDVDANKSSDCSGGVWRISGANIFYPINSYAVNDNETAATTQDSPSVTTDENNTTLLLGIYPYRKDTTANPGTLDGTNLKTDTNATSQFAHDAGPETAGASGTSTWTFGSNTNNNGNPAFTIAINPASGTPVPNDTGHRYWRFNFLDTYKTVGGNNTRIAQLELHTAAGSEDQDTVDTGSVIHLSTLGAETGDVGAGMSAILTDGSLAAEVNMDNSDPSTFYISYDLGIGNEALVKYFRIAFGADGDTRWAHTDVSIGYSDDGSTWTDSAYLDVGTLYTTNKFSGGNYIAIPGTQNYTDDYLPWLETTYPTLKLGTDQQGTSDNNYRYLENSVTASGQAAWGRPSQFTHDSRVAKVVGMSYPDVTVLGEQDGLYVAIEWDFVGSYASYVSVTLNGLTSTAYTTFDGGNVAKLIYWDDTDPAADSETGAVTVLAPT